MSQVNINTQQAWLKVLGKGMVTLPKRWREDMGVTTGDIIKAKKAGGKIVIETQQTQRVPYRLYSDAEIDQFLKVDKLPKSLAKKVKANLSVLSRK